MSQRPNAGIPEDAGGPAGAARNVVADRHCGNKSDIRGSQIRLRSSSSTFSAESQLPGALRTASDAVEIALAGVLQPQARDEIAPINQKFRAVETSWLIGENSPGRKRSDGLPPRLTDSPKLSRPATAGRYSSHADRTASTGNRPSSSSLRRVRDVRPASSSSSTRVGSTFLSTTQSLNHLSLPPSSYIIRASAEDAPETSPKRIRPSCVSPPPARRTSPAALDCSTFEGWSRAQGPWATLEPSVPLTSHLRRARSWSPKKGPKLLEEFRPAFRTEWLCALKQEILEGVREEQTQMRKCFAEAVDEMRADSAVAVESICGVIRASTGHLRGRDHLQMQVPIEAPELDEKLKDKFESIMNSIIKLRAQFEAVSAVFDLGPVEASIHGLATSASEERTELRTGLQSVEGKIDMMTEATPESGPPQLTEATPEFGPPILEELAKLEAHVEAMRTVARSRAAAQAKRQQDDSETLQSSFEVLGSDLKGSIKDLSHKFDASTASGNFFDDLKSSIKDLCHKVDVSTASQPASQPVFDIAPLMAALESLVSAVSKRQPVQSMTELEDAMRAVIAEISRMSEFIQTLGSPAPSNKVMEPLISALARLEQLPKLLEFEGPMRAALEEILSISECITALGQNFDGVSCQLRSVKTLIEDCGQVAEKTLEAQSRSAGLEAVLLRVDSKLPEPIRMSNLLAKINESDQRVAALHQELQAVQTKLQELQAIDMGPVLQQVGQIGDRTETGIKASVNTLLSAISTSTPDLKPVLSAITEANDKVSHALANAAEDAKKQSETLSVLDKALKLQGQMLPVDLGPVLASIADVLINSKLGVDTVLKAVSHVNLDLGPVLKASEKSSCALMRAFSDAAGTAEKHFVVLSNVDEAIKHQGKLLPVDFGPILDHISEVRRCSSEEVSSVLNAVDQIGQNLLSLVETTGENDAVTSKARSIAADETQKQAQVLANMESMISRVEEQLPVDFGPVFTQLADMASSSRTCTISVLGAVSKVDAVVGVLSDSMIEALSEAEKKAGGRASMLARIEKTLACQAKVSDLQPISKALNKSDSKALQVSKSAAEESKKHWAILSKIDNAVAQQGVVLARLTESRQKSLLWTTPSSQW